MPRLLLVRVGLRQVLPLIRPLIPLIFVSHNFALFQLVLDKFLDFSCLTLGTYVDPGQKF